MSSNSTNDSNNSKNNSNSHRNNSSGEQKNNIFFNQRYSISNIVNDRSYRQTVDRLATPSIRKGDEDYDIDMDGSAISISKSPVPDSGPAYAIAGSYKTDNANQKSLLCQKIPVVDSTDTESIGSRHSSRSPAHKIDEAGAREFLTSKGWPPGLQKIFIRNLHIFPIRFFVCDDSGSMLANDGHRLVKKNEGQRMKTCARWTELGEAMKFHLNIARAANAATEFRLLNASTPLLIGTRDPESDENYHKFLSILGGQPGGGTPLCRHIREIVAKIRILEPKLRARKQKACVIIATDGESSDGDIAAAMRPLANLPVWVVVRLCTDEESIMNYWNTIDKELELDMDVLDDFCAEAEEVFEANCWLNYGEPIHRLREFGIPLKEIDLLDERLLSMEFLRTFVCNLFGVDSKAFPQPELDWEGFCDRIRQENEKLPTVWSAIDRIPKPWIDIDRLTYCYKPSRCTIM